MRLSQPRRRMLAGIAVWLRLLLFGVAACWAGAALADARRVALVIGNAAYKDLPGLANPGNDVDNVAAVLRAAGFDVVVGVDLKRVALEKTIERFFRSLGRTDVSLFYYSGHGVQIAGKNYIIPVDASLKSAYDVETQAMNLDTILDFMRANTRTQLIFLDACRNNPFGAKAYWVADKLEPVKSTAGLASIKPSVGTLIAFATEPGSVSYDGGSNPMSPFTGAFVKRALTPNEEIRTTLTQIRRDVVDVTGGRQVPWENSSLVDDFYLLPRRSPPRVAAMTKITVSAGQSAPLALPQPEVDGSSKVTVTFDLLPDNGHLVVDGAPVETGKAYPAEVLGKAVYQTGNTPIGATNVAAFTVSDELGQATRGLVALSVANDLPKPAVDERVAQDQALDRTTAALARMAVSAPIGVGPVAVAGAAKEPGVQVASLDTPAPGMQLKVTDTPPTGIVRLGDKALSTGAVLDADGLSRLSYEPQVGEENRPQTLKVEVVAAGDAPPRPAAVTMTPVVDACDTLAGEPLDLQGVTKGVLPNEIKLPDALDACRAAVSRYPNVPRFTYQLGRAQLASRDVAGAMASFTEAAKKRHARANYGIGYLHQVGAGRPIDLAVANRFFGRNADFGDPYGMLTLGRNLYYGRGIAMDRGRGLRLMTKAAELGHTYAMNELGAIFLEGRGIGADPGRGIAYYQQGAARDDIYSYNNLGLAFLRGQGVARDDKAAASMFTKAMDGGHPSAPANLGLLYLEGRSVAKDADKARDLFEQAIARGDWYGAMMRGDLALQGDGAAGQADAARYYALAIAFDRYRQAPEVGRKLAALPQPARQAALDGLAAALPKPAGGSLDQRLVQAARADWQRKNPRMDLF